MTASAPELSIDELRTRPTITVPEYAAFVGVSRDAAYEAAARGELRVLRVGRRVLVPTRPLLAALGYLDGEACHCRDGHGPA